MVQFALMNGARVEVSAEEIKEFITQQVIIANPDWRHSGLLTEEEVTRYLKNLASPEDLKKVARYILIYQENLAFTGFLFDKSEGRPDQGKEFNMPALKKLRDIYQKMSDMPRSPGELAGDVHEMESTCLEIGADPL